MNAFLKFWQKTPYAQLKSRGVLGMNQRNIDYISRYNPRELFPLVDDKLKTKYLALEHDVKVPELIDVVVRHRDIRKLYTKLGERSGFCIKPSKGSGGKGILVIRNSSKGFIRPDGRVLPPDVIERHISNILAGLFSLGGATDVAIIEALIEVDERFKRFSYSGVPDLRVIVFRGFPLMAMMRLSTEDSQGKANLHQGAIGVGIDIATGTAIHAVKDNRYIHHHPDTKQVLSQLEIPAWDELLHLACACYEMTELGYLGVDLVIDKVYGPLLLELNARPGLSIQIANSKGLLPRLQAIEALNPKQTSRWSISERIAWIKASVA